MGFHDERFPTNLSLGSAGGPGFNTAIIELASGAEERISRWSASKGRWDAGYSIRRAVDLHTVQAFYRAR